LPELSSCGSLFFFGNNLKIALFSIWYKCHGFVKCLQFRKTIIFVIWLQFRNTVMFWETVTVWLHDNSFVMWLQFRNVVKVLLNRIFFVKPLKKFSKMVTISWYSMILLGYIIFIYENKICWNGTRALALFHLANQNKQIMLLLVTSRL